MRRVPAIAAVTAATTLAAAPAALGAPYVKTLRCYDDCVGIKKVAPGGRVQLFGKRFRSGMRAVFPVRASDGSLTFRSTKTRLTHSRTLIARVPRNGRSGRVVVEIPGGARSNPVRVKVGTAPPHETPPPGATPFDRAGMWIWYVSAASGGSPQAIADQAREHGVGTVFVKSGDAGNYWSQFSSELVADLRAGGLDVCAWQFVYGTHPKDEARVAARAIDAGADCFVIDAEGQYEGKYTSARTYMSRLRAAAGAEYPIALAGFPYVDYHPAFPFSVFFGPGGAQYNVPQAYWKDIGGTVDTVLDHTYAWNRPYGRPIAPLGQVYENPRRGEILRFRKYAEAAGSDGVSWWSWQHANDTEWEAVGEPITPMRDSVPTDFATLAGGARGDIVLWAQQHLAAAGQDLDLDGVFGSGTKRAVKRFQSGAGLAATGSIDTATWTALLEYTPLRSRGKVAAGGAGGPVPKTAGMPATRYEIPPPEDRRP